MMAVLLTVKTQMLLRINQLITKKGDLFIKVIFGNAVVTLDMIL